MQKKLRALTLGFVFLTVLVWATAGFAQGPAVSRGLVKPGLHPKMKMTDAAGREHRRPTPRISDAQRKAAAQLRKALRAKNGHIAGKSEVKK